MDWTDEQDQVLFDYGYFGVAECKRILHKTLGVSRSESAIQSRASRLGISLRECHVCTECGSVVAKVNRDGICKVCRQRSLNEKQRQIHSDLLWQLKHSTTEQEYEQEVKTYRSLRQANRRLRRKLESS